MTTDDDLITTGAAAELLGCSRQHVVNLCNRGDLSVTSSGTHRKVSRQEVEALGVRGSRLTKEEVRSLWLGYAVAGRLVMEPELVLERARQNLRHMQSIHPRGQAAARLRDWDELLESSIGAVLEALTSRSPRARELRQNSPFAGVLTDLERQGILRSVTSAALAGPT